MPFRAHVYALILSTAHGFANYVAKTLVEIIADRTNTMYKNKRLLRQLALCPCEHALDETLAGQHPPPVTHSWDLWWHVLLLHGAVPFKSCIDADVVQHSGCHNNLTAFGRRELQCPSKHTNAPVTTNDSRDTP